MSAVLFIVAWLVVANLATFFAFGADKRLAEAKASRIPERRLLFLAFIGGTIGAMTAQRYFRHKTYKEPFRSRLHAIAFFQLAALLVLLLSPDSRVTLAGLTRL